MTRALVFLAALAAILWGVELLLGPARSDGAHAPRLVRLADAARPGDTVVAGVSLELPPGGERVLYVRSKGVWRCVSAWGAPCEARRVEELVLGLLGARGVVRARSLERRADFGLAPGESLGIALHGKALLDDPAGDELLRLAVGAPGRVGAGSAAASSGAFVRLEQGDEVLELDFDPRAALGPPHPRGLPPLLDPRLAAQAFPGSGRRVERLFLDRADGSGLELVRRAREALPPGPGLDPAETLDWEWLLVEGERQRVISPLRGEAYVTFAPRAPYVALDDPRRAAEHGLDTPAARLTLVPDEGDPLELELAAPGPDGSVWVRVPSVPLLALVDAATARMLLPDADELEDDTRPNAWDAWLRAELAK